MTPSGALGEFLLARIAEDESAARAAGVESWQVIASDVHLTGENANEAVAVGPYGSPIGRAAIHIVRHQPANVLAECEAKRRIVELAGWTGAKDSLRDRVFGPAADEAFQQGIKSALRLLALPYADHPDYREEWKP